MSNLGLENEHQRSNCQLLLDYRESKGFSEKIYLCFMDSAKAFDWVDHNKLWKVLREMGIPNHHTCLLRNLYLDQEAIVRTMYGTTDWFKIKKEVKQVCLLSQVCLSVCLTNTPSTS